METAGTLAHWHTRPLAGRQAAIAEELANSLFSQTNCFFVCIFRFFFVPLRGNLHKCARTEKYILFLGYSCCSCCLSGYGGRKWSPSPCPRPLRGGGGVRPHPKWWLWIVFRLSYHSPRPLPPPRRRGGGVRTRPRWWLWIVFRLNRRRAPAGWRRP